MDIETEIENTTCYPVVQRFTDGIIRLEDQPVGCSSSPGAPSLRTCCHHINVNNKVTITFNRVDYLAKLDSHTEIPIRPICWSITVIIGICWYLLVHYCNRNVTLCCDIQTSVLWTPRPRERIQHATPLCNGSQMV